jgi:hypothetical protein
MTAKAFEYGYNFAAAALGIKPEEYRHGGIPKHASSSVGKNICLAGSFLFKLAGRTDSPAFEKLAAAAAADGWSSWQAEAAEDVTYSLEPLTQLFMEKKANPAFQLLNLNAATKLPGFLSPLAVTPGLLNLYSTILGASAVAGAASGFGSWQNRRVLEKEEKPVEEARAEHMILRQAIGDIEARMAAREASRSEL